MWLLPPSSSGFHPQYPCSLCQETEIVGDFLKDKGIRSDYYHAGMTDGQRTAVQTAWHDGAIEVVVATIAYGMGINNPHVRYVVHFAVAKSIEG